MREQVLLCIHVTRVLVKCRLWFSGWSEGQVPGRLVLPACGLPLSTVGIRGLQVASWENLLLFKTCWAQYLVLRS